MDHFTYALPQLERGKHDPCESHDLEDILALVVSRPPIVNECRVTPALNRAQLRAGFEWLTKNSEYDDLVAGHLRNAQSFRETAMMLRQSTESLIRIG